jgi:hypothetical protein
MSSNLHMTNYIYHGEFYLPNWFSYCDYKQNTSWQDGMLKNDVLNYWFNATYSKKQNLVKKLTALQLVKKFSVFYG